MKFFDKLGKLEQGIGRTVGFSKGFGTFEKADVANRVRIMMDDESYVDGSGRTMAPNIYTLRFAPVEFSARARVGQPVRRGAVRPGHLSRSRPGIHPHRRGARDLQRSRFPGRG